MTLRCRIVSEFFGAQEWDAIEVNDILYSAHIPLDQADALLVIYDPAEELLRFEGPKLWWTMEPSWHYHFRGHPVGQRLMRTLRPSEHSFYGHPDPVYRVPHPTYRSHLTMPRQESCRDRAVACVSNFGGRAWFTKAHFRLRNRFILHPAVELYGKAEAWKRFRHFPQLWRSGAPANYQHLDPPGNDCRAEELIRFLSGFKVAVCLENCEEPYYFTEKFVNAARAGCIPIYHPHPTVSEHFLTGAKWVDPADFDYLPERVIPFALSENQLSYRQANDAWLRSGILAETDDQKLVPQLQALIHGKLTGVLPS